MNTPTKKQTPVNSKLFKLKEWLTVPEAAKYLTTIFGEEVTEADVLRLSLDRHLKLSVYFVNHANARYGGKFLPFREWEQNLKNSCSWENLKPSVGHEGTLGFYLPNYDFVFFPGNAPVVKGMDQWEKTTLDTAKSEYLESFSLEQRSALLAHVIEYCIEDHKNKSKKYGGKVPPTATPEGKEVLSIKGVWDLPLLGSERIDIEHQYQQLTGGPEVTLMCMDGAWVESQQGEVWQLQEKFDFEERKKQSGDLGLKINKRNEGQPKKSFFRDPENYFPAGALPEDSVLVVRTSALLDMQERLTEVPTVSQKTNPKVEKSNLRIIGAMLQIIMDKKEFNSEEELRKHIDEKYKGFAGCAERTLAGRFADAKKLLAE